MALTVNPLLPRNRRLAAVPSDTPPKLDRYPTALYAQNSLCVKMMCAGRGVLICVYFFMGNNLVLKLFRQICECIPLYVRYTRFINIM